MVRLETEEGAVHDAAQEVDDGAAVVGLLAYELVEPALEDVGAALAALGRFLFHGGDAAHGAYAAVGVAEVGGGVLDQVLGDEAWGDLVYSPSGGRSVVVAEAFEGALGDAQVELDNAAAVVGLLADYLREGWVFLLCCYAHKFYHITRVKREGFTTEDTEGTEVGLWGREGGSV